MFRSFSARFPPDSREIPKTLKHPSETYPDPASGRRHMLDLQIAQKRGEIIRFLGTPPGAGATFRFTSPPEKIR
jgi:hypothetical protein